MSEGLLHKKIREILTLDLEHINGKIKSVDIPTRNCYTKAIEVVAEMKADFFKTPENSWGAPSEFLDEDYIDYPGDYREISKALKEWFERWFGE